MLIPEDDFPSATQAGVVDYIDFALAGDYGRGERLYMRPPFFEGAGEQGWQVGTPASLIRTGLTALREGNDVTALDEAGRERWVQALSEYEEPLGDVPAGTFFDEVHSLTNEGYFADPIYLGNHDYAGWRMVGFPGAHAYYTERVDDQQGIARCKPPMGIGTIPGRPERQAAPRLNGRKGLDPMACRELPRTDRGQLRGRRRLGRGLSGRQYELAKRRSRQRCDGCWNERASTRRKTVDGPYTQQSIRRPGETMDELKYAIASRGTWWILQQGHAGTNPNNRDQQGPMPIGAMGRSCRVRPSAVPAFH